MIGVQPTVCITVRDLCVEWCKLRLITECPKEIAHAVERVVFVQQVWQGVMCLVTCSHTETFFSAQTSMLTRLCSYRLTDDSDRMWLLNYVKDVTNTRLGTDFDDAFRALLPTRHATADLEDLRRIFFTDFMDAAAEEAHQRKYDEAQVICWQSRMCIPKRS